jgi:hypothetical protein
MRQTPFMVHDWEHLPDLVPRKAREAAESHESHRISPNLTGLKAGKCCRACISSASSLIWCATHTPKKIPPRKGCRRGAAADGVKRRKVIIGGSCPRPIARPIMGYGFARLPGNTGQKPGAIAHNASSGSNDWRSIRQPCPGHSGLRRRSPRNAGRSARPCVRARRLPFGNEHGLHDAFLDKVLAVAPGIERQGDIDGRADADDAVA